MTVTGNITSIAPDNGPHSGGFIIDVYGGPFPVSGSGIQGWRWRLGSEVIPHTLIDSGHIRLQTRSPLLNNPGPTTVLNEDQQPGQTYGTADFLINEDAAPLPPDIVMPGWGGLWRLTLHKRAFAANLNPTTDLFISEIYGARSIKLEQKLSDSATLSFTLEGHSPAASLISELQTDVIAWRWDDQSSRYIALFRGIVAQTQDTLSEQSDTLTVTCHDYLDMLKRRLLTKPQTFTQADQDDIANSLIQWGAKTITTSGNVSLSPGCYLPMTLYRVNPAGQSRGLSGVKRDRQYAAQQDVSEAFNNLSGVDSGFDFDIIPGLQANPSTTDDQVRVFYPYAGILRDDVILEYGSTVRALSRSVNSGDYANYVRNIGQNAASDQPPIYAEARDPSSNNVNQDAQGLWMAGFNDSDVTVALTLQQHANGYLKRASLLSPSYSLTLRPNVYQWGRPRMGDIIRLIIKAGRLNVDTSELRVVGISYDVGEDGGEDISLDIGRADVTFANIITASARDIDALARR